MENSPGLDSKHLPFIKLLFDRDGSIPVDENHRAIADQLISRGYVEETKDGIWKLTEDLGKPIAQDLFQPKNYGRKRKRT